MAQEILLVNGKRRTPPRYKSGPKKGQFMSKRAQAARKGGRKAASKRKASSRRRAPARRGTAPRVTRVRRRGRSTTVVLSNPGPKSFFRATASAAPPAIAFGAGLLGPPALARMVTTIDAAPDFLRGPAGFYGVNALAVAGGWMVMRKVKRGRYAIPFLAGGLVQLVALGLAQYVPQAANALGIGASPVLPTGGAVAGITQSRHLGGITRTAGHVSGIRRELRAA